MLIDPPRWKRLAVAAMFELYERELITDADDPTYEPDFQKAAELLAERGPIDTRLLDRALCRQGHTSFTVWWLYFQESRAVDDRRVWARVAAAI